jgi:hypothetical protein
MDADKKRGWDEQIARLRSATPDERLRAAARQRDISTELLRAGLRLRFPDLDEEGIEFKRGEITFGAEVWQSICERRRRRTLGHREA